MAEATELTGETSGGWAPAGTRTSDQAAPRRERSQGADRNEGRAAGVFAGSGSPTAAWSGDTGSAARAASNARCAGSRLAAAPGQHVRVWQCRAGSRSVETPCPRPACCRGGLVACVSPRHALRGEDFLSTSSRAASGTCAFSAETHGRRDVGSRVSLSEAAPAPPCSVPSRLRHLGRQALGCGVAARSALLQAGELCCAQPGQVQGLAC